ncbi:MAG: hypothetical protein Tsb008_01610 [Rhodothalassiaceae bacterium]
MAKDSPVRRDTLLALLIVAAALSLAVGFGLPVLRIQRFFFFTDSVSLPEMILALIGDGEIAIGLILFLFTIVFPVAKLLWLMLLWWRPTAQGLRSLRLLAAMGRWSMLDILVLALAIFSIKASGLATAAAEPALYGFTAAVLLGIAAGRRLGKLTGGAEAEQCDEDTKTR